MDDVVSLAWKDLDDMNLQGNCEKSKDPIMECE